MSDPTTDAITDRNAELERLRAHNRKLRQLVRSFVARGMIVVDPASPAAELLGEDPEPVDYTKMSESEMATACGDNAECWAEAFCQHADKLDIRQVGRPHRHMDVGWVMGWFANAIERSDFVRSQKKFVPAATLRTDAEIKREAVSRPTYCTFKSGPVTIDCDPGTENRYPGNMTITVNGHSLDVQRADVPNVWAAVEEAARAYAKVEREREAQVTPCESYVGENRDRKCGGKRFRTLDNEPIPGIPVGEVCLDCHTVRAKK